MLTDEIKSQIAQLQQMGPDFMKQCCIINGSIWSLQDIDRMDFEEYGTRSVYSLPQKLYKYFPDVDRIEEDNGIERKINYSIQVSGDTLR